MAVSALLDTGFDMDRAKTATAFRTSKWTRRRRPAPWDASFLADTLALRGAASAVSAFLDAGLEMDEATTAAVFRATADAVVGDEAPCKQELVT